MKDKIIAAVASIPQRVNALEHAVNSMIGQVDDLYVVLNNYTDIPKFLIGNKKITILKSQEIGDYGALGKFFPLTFLKKSFYYFCFDDDNIHPKDYVHNYLKTLEKYHHKVLVCTHGSIFADPLYSYYQRFKQFGYQQENATDKIVNLLGSGTLGYHSSTIDIDFNFLYNRLYPQAIDDLQVSIIAKQNNIPVICIKRPKGWIKYMKDMVGSGTFSEYSENITIHTPIVKMHEPWGYNHVSDYVIPILHEIFDDLTEEKIAKHSLDRDFILNYKTTKIPRNWSAHTKIYKQTTEKVFFLYKSIYEHERNEYKEIEPDYDKLWRAPGAGGNISDRKINEHLKYPGIDPSKWNKEPVQACVASFSLREIALKNMVESIYDQVDILYIYLNDYEYIPDFLNKKKIFTYMGKDFCDLKANGKVYFLDKISSGYIFILDDDIIYPKDYVRKCIACIEKYKRKALISIHGSILSDTGSWYYHKTGSYPFQNELITDKFVNQVGSGTISYHTETLKLKFNDFYPYTMVDLAYSLYATENNIPLVCMARPKMWLIYQRDIVKDGLWEKFSQQYTIHTPVKIAHGPWSFERFSKFIIPVLESIFGSLDQDMINKNGLDSDFINSYYKSKIPTYWSIKTNMHKVTTKQMLKFYRDMYNQIRNLIKKIDHDEYFATYAIDNTENTNNTQELLSPCLNLASFLDYDLNKKLASIHNIFVADSDNYEKILNFGDIDYILTQDKFLPDNTITTIRNITTKNTNKDIRLILLLTDPSSFNGFESLLNYASNFDICFCKTAEFVFYLYHHGVNTIHIDSAESTDMNFDFENSSFAIRNLRSLNNSLRVSLR